MKTIKQSIVILLAVLVVATVASNWYYGTSTSGIPPTISCPADVLQVSVKDLEQNPEKLLQGVVATDAQDGDLTHRISIGGISKLITNDTAKVTYMVFDSDNNVASCVRRIQYTDYHRPTFEVTEPLIYSSTEEVTLLSRLKATDVRDGDISQNIRVSTLEPTKNSEVYNVTIQASNEMGDTSYVTLPVVLQETKLLRPTIQLNEYLVYLNKGDSFSPINYYDFDSSENPSYKELNLDNQVDTSTPGTYYVNYSYTANGLTGMAILTVVVQ